MHTQTAPKPKSRSIRFQSAIPYLIVAAAAALRLINLDEVSLWYDEIQSVTHANRPFPLSFISTQEYDCHPPLYSLLLGIWMLLGRDDVTILLSSVLASCATVYLVYRILEKLADQRHAMVGACVLALHPFSIYWSHFARMYSLLMLLCLACFWAHQRFFQCRRAAGWIGFWLLVSEFCILASHIAGLFFLFFIWLYFLASRAEDKESWKRWIMFHLKASPVYLLPMIITLERVGRESETIPDFQSVLVGLSRFSLGVQADAGMLVPAAALIFCAFQIVLLAAPHKRYRWYGFTFMLLPFCLTFCISWMGKPIWHNERVFAFLIPFFAMGFALIWYAEWKHRGVIVLSRLLLLTIIGLMSWGSIRFVQNHEKRETYIEAADMLRAKAKPTDLVLASTPRVAWGVKRYLIGPDWDNNLWEEYFSIPDEICRNLDFSLCLRRKMYTYDIQTRGASPRVAVSENPDLDIKNEKRIWIITRNNKEHPALVKKYQLPKESEMYEQRGTRLALHEL